MSRLEPGTVSWHLVSFAARARRPCLGREEAQDPAGAAARGSPAAPERVTSVEGITEYRLANGLRVLLFPDQSKQTITVNITYLVGSRHENYGETGMAHLLEHLVFKGSPRHPDIPQELAAHGARPNGTTSWDRTNYFETFNATEENLRWALDLEADRMVNSFIAKKDLDSEMTVVRNEFEMGENQPVGVLFKRLLSVAFDWHNYGNTADRRALGHRGRADRAAAGVLPAPTTSPTTPCCWWPASSTRRPRWRWCSEYFGRIPRPTRVLADAAHHRADAGRRTPGDAAPRRRRAVVAAGLSRALRLA